MAAGGVGVIPPGNPQALYCRESKSHACWLQLKAVNSSTYPPRSGVQGKLCLR